ncbi:MAG: four helix bundle protein, partial [Candidatus Cloacimonadia bacterium]
NDFIAKMYIALKEAKGKNYWLRILSDEDFVKSCRIKSLKDESVEIIKVITSIIKSTRKQKSN